jgi:hypothetical protein
MAANLSKIIQNLKRFYGEPLPPKTTDPFELILLEGIAYLVDDERRERALEHLRKTVGLRPADILNAALRKLMKQQNWEVLLLNTVQSE